MHEINKYQKLKTTLNKYAPSCNFAFNENAERLIRKMKEFPMLMTETDWKEVRSYICSSKPDTWCVCIAALRCSQCPEELKKEIHIYAHNKDVLMETLRAIKGSRMAEITVDTIGMNYIYDTCRKLIGKGFEPQMDYFAMQVCGMQHIKETKGLFLPYIKEEGMIRNYLKDNELTEDECTILLNNKYLPSHFRVDLANKYGYAIDELTVNAPEIIKNEAVDAIMQTVFDDLNIEQRIKENATRQLLTAYEKGIISDIRQSKIFLKMRDNDKDSNLAKLKQLLAKNIKQTFVLSGYNGYEKYQNKNLDSFKLNTDIIIKVSELKEGTISTKHIPEIAEMMIRHNNIFDDTIRKLMSLDKPKTKDNRYRSIYIEMVANPRVDDITINKIMQRYPNDDKLNILGNLTLAYKKMGLSYEKIDYLNMIILETSQRMLDTKETGYMEKELYITKKEFNEIEKILSAEKEKGYGEDKTYLDKVRKISMYDRLKIEMYEEFPIFFADHKDMMMPQIGYGKTLCADNIKDYTEKELKLLISQLDERQCKSMQNMVLSFIDNCIDRVLVYENIEKFNQLFNLLEEEIKLKKLIKEKEEKSIEISEVESR